MSNINILQIPDFKRADKKPHKNQRTSTDQAIIEILKVEIKKRDLFGVYVCKFNSISQQYLLAYAFDFTHQTFLALGVYENFYRNLKKSLKVL